MGTATVIERSREELLSERQAALRTLGMTLETAQRVVDAGGLEADEYRALRRIEGIDWLLDE
ncbi:MAG: hypothetical protein Q4G67_15825 [Actinomycetia bacterium]|nr:hypothetical protein [Actinomycetes bacterium]